jgi:hypothetical protein
VAIRFVGRDRELVQLVEAFAALGRGAVRGLDGAPKSRGQLFVIAGEPGIGKSRLCDELVREVQRQGAHVAWGAAWDGGGAPAYWPWVQVVRALRPALPAFDDRLQAELGPLADERISEELGGDVELMRFRRFDALRSVLSAAAARGPLVVVLEDIHAADVATLQALRFVARALRSLPLLLLATQRDAAWVAPELAEPVAQIAREGTTLALGRLERGDVATILADLEPVPEALVDDVFQVSGGNPFFVSETLRAVRMGAEPRAPGSGVGTIVRERLSRLGAAARDALESAAVLGREVSLATLAHMGSCSASDLEASLREPRQAGIVEVDGAVLRFCHALFREGLYDDLLPERRVVLHLRAGEALARRTTLGLEASDESVARHLLAALPAGDVEQALDWALRAGRSALGALAFDRAATLLEGALVALERLPADPGRRIDIMLLLAEALAASGGGERGRTLCSAAAREARASGDGARLARAALAFGSQLRIAVVDRELIALLGEALALLDAGDRRLRARVLARLAAAQQPAPDPEVPMREARAAILLARESGDPDTLLAVIYTAGSALVDYAPPAERLALARELTALALPRGELVRAQQGYARMTIDLLELGNITAAELAVAAHEQLGEALGHARWRWRSSVMRSMLALMAGRWEEAERAQAQAALLAEASDDPNALTTLAYHRMGALRAREAASAVDLSSLWESSLQVLEGGEALRAALGASLLARCGDLPGARRLLGTVDLDHAYFRHDVAVLSVLIDAIALTGNRPLAERFLPIVEHHAERFELVSWGVFGMVWEGPIDRWRALLLGLVERWDAAVDACERALGSSETLGARPLAARLRLELAALLRKRNGEGDAVRARSLVAHAHAQAAELAMTHLARAAEAAGALEGVATRSAPAPAPALSLEREGELWRVAWGGKEARLKHSRSLELLQQLVESPGREFHVLDLAGGRNAMDAGDAGPALDEAAKRDYQRRIRELGAELDEAEGWADVGRCERLRAELEFLRVELARGVGLGGRNRRSSSAVERARVNLQKRLRSAVRRIAAVLPELGEHLDAQVKTGTYVSYRLPTATVAGPSHGP